MSDPNNQPGGEPTGDQNQPAANNQQPPANTPNPKGEGTPPSDNAAPSGDPAAPGGDDAAAKAEADRKAVIEQATKEAQAKAKADMDAAIKTWKDAVAADPELGGDKAEATKVDVQGGLKALARGEALQQLLDATGLIHHPDVVATLAQIGRMTREGRFITGAVPREKPQSRAQRLYDKTPA